MRMGVKPLSVSGSRLESVSISLGKDDEGNPSVKLDVEGGKPVVRSDFSFSSAKFEEVEVTEERGGKSKRSKEHAARLEARLWIGAVSTGRGGVLAKLSGKGGESIVAEVEVLFSVLIIGSGLEIENIRLAWDSREVNRTITKNELEQVYRMAVSSEIPEALKKGVDSQALLLLELLRNSRIEFS